jgi:hypothetical protein
VVLSATRWEDATDEEVPPDDQHAPCRGRAIREAYWRRRIPSGDLAAFVLDAALDIRPDLERPVVNIRPDLRGAWLAGLRGVHDAWGDSPAAAIADLLAHLEDRGEL